MTPESFNAQLAIRKLEAADILLQQAKTGSNADRIRAASAVLRMAFMEEPKPTAKKLQTLDAPITGAPKSPQRSEEIPGAPTISPRVSAPSPESPTPDAPQSLQCVAIPSAAPVTPPPEPAITGYCGITGRALYSP